MKPKTRLVRDDAQVVCDFCSDQPVLWWYEVTGTVILGEGTTEELAEAFQTVPEYPYHLEGAPLQAGGRVVTYSTDHWAACGACAALLEANDQAGVTNRSVEQISARYTWLRRSPWAQAALAAQIGAMHAQFFRVWTRTRVPYERKETKP